MLNNLAKEIHENAKSKGFFDSEKNIGEMLCLIHSEVSEALEADRKNKYADLPKFEELLEIEGEQHFDFAFKHTIKDTFEDELADVVIRVLGLCAFKGIDIESHIKAKMRYNSTRPHKHGKNY